MNCCDHNECCVHSDDRIGAEIGMLHNLLRRQMACMTEKTANAANVTGMQAMIVHHLLIHEKQGDIFQKDLENAFQMRRSTATGILQLMEQHGIIRRSRRVPWMNTLLSACCRWISFCGRASRRRS